MKYEYVLILAANALLFLFIGIAARHCNDNSQELHETYYPWNKQERKVVNETERVEYQYSEGKTKIHIIEKTELVKPVSENNEQSQYKLYRNFSIYSFFNY